MTALLKSCQAISSSADDEQIYPYIIAILFISLVVVSGLIDRNKRRQINSNTSDWHFDAFNFFNKKILFYFHKIKEYWLFIYYDYFVKYEEPNYYAKKI